MTPTWSVLEGDSVARLRELDAGSVHTCVTSPPYFGLRDYGTEGQIGLEPTPDEYVAALVGVFREVRRVLRDDGTVWLNLGDSYGSGGSGGSSPASTLTGGGGRYRDGSKQASMHDADSGVRKVPAGYKPKDLLGIPWLVAFALRADGWYLRSDIIWSKPNPMPESVTDRPTKAHEYVFLLAKGGKWKARVVECADLPSEPLHLGADLGAKRPDLVAGDFSVRLATAILDRTESHDDLGLRALDSEVRQERAAGIGSTQITHLPVEHWAPVLASRLLHAEIAPKEFLGELHRREVALTDGDKLLISDGLALVSLPPGVTRYGETAVAIHHPGEVREFDLRHNRIILSEPPTSCSYFYDADAIREAHGDTNTSRAAALERHGDGATGEWIPGAVHEDDPHRSQLDHRGLPGVGTTFGKYNSAGRNKRSVWTVATQPYAGAHFATFPPKLIEPCILAGCPDGGTVLDPFAGSGTTGMVALRHGRSFTGIELNPAYAALARDRITADAPLLNSFAEVAEVAV